MTETTLIQPALQHPNQSIGVDISKDKFDAFAFPIGARNCFSNDKSGFESFLKWLPQNGLERIVFEPTGAYHHGFERYVGGTGLPLCKVNPYHSRAFARSTGTRMKSDAVDAFLLGKMGAERKLAPRPILSEDIDTMRELNVARAALVKEKTAVSNRKATARHTIIKDQLAARLKDIKVNIDEIDAEIARIIDADPDLKARKKILMSIPSIGLVTANILIITMPELGHISNGQAQSGKHFGKAHIGGGRAHVRYALYMPALVAIQHNPDLKAKFEQLTKTRSLPRKVALVAIMRKLLILANTLLLKQRQWTKLST
ncbi:MAG: hypothetical protein RL186_350 [Pseudomonadota bacterium]